MRLDGADISAWDKQKLGPHLGYLPQDIELFEGSISDNFARFANVDPGKVVVAARIAGVHEMILRLREGYDTVIGSEGVNLSGGQRQRVALARAVYGSPRLIVLDEPNSAVQNEFKARGDLLKSQYDFITNLFILNRWAGKLSQESVASVNVWLGGDDSQALKDLNVSSVK